MNSYNYDFLVAGFVLLMLIVYHYLDRKRTDNEKSRYFRLMIWLGTLDLLFDMLTTYLIEHPNPTRNGICVLLFTIFYLLQISIPFILFCYTEVLRETTRERRGTERLLGSFLFAGMTLIVLANVVTGWIFYFDSKGIYSHGPLYLSAYCYTAFYVVLICFLCFLHRREYQWKNLEIIGEFLLLMMSCVLVQAFNSHQMTTGFGIALGIMILYLTINNPESYIDHLTGAYDVYYLKVWMGEQLERKKTLHLLAVDLQQLRRINKVFGNSAGDDFLREVAGMLQEAGDSVWVFRYSGRRFFVLMESMADYERVKIRLAEMFAANFTVCGEEFHVTVRICGITDVKKLESFDTFTAYADYLLSLAPKHEDTILIQDDDKTMEGFLYTREVERYLKTAVEEDLFEIYYQPVYSLQEKRFVSLEALSRLRHPNLGWVSPDVFITAAERSGIISQIGQLQLTRICRFVEEHAEEIDGIENVKVNLSPLELLNPGHCRRLIEIIRSHDLPFDLFQFEITETVATEYSENLYEIVTDFREMGIRLCLDDFGSGYANLNTVLQLPFSVIKLDRSLLEGACVNDQMASFYQNIVSILQNMGFRIVAEGAETEKQVELLTGWGVDMIQGYYFSKPLEPKDLLTKIAGREENESNGD